MKKEKTLQEVQEQISELQEEKEEIIGSYKGA